MGAVQALRPLGRQGAEPRRAARCRGRSRGSATPPSRECGCCHAGHGCCGSRSETSGPSSSRGLHGRSGPLGSKQVTHWASRHFVRPLTEPAPATSRLRTPQQPGTQVLQRRTLTFRQVPWLSGSVFKEGIQGSPELSFLGFILRSSR